MKYVSVKNFEHFQHYKDRRPPWIKLYQEVLEDYEFTRLQDASRSHLLSIWLLASRYENRVPCDAKWIERAILASSPVDLEVLVRAGFLTVSEDASEPLADNKQVAKPEVETEREVEKEKKRTSSRPAADAGVEEKQETAFALGPYITVHRERFDADPPAARYGKVLKRMESKYGPAEVFRRWKIFTTAKGELGPEYFERTWRDWDKPPPAKPSRNGGPPEDDEKLRFVRLQQSIDDRKREEDGDEWWARMEREARARGARNHRDVMLYAEKFLVESAA